MRALLATELLEVWERGLSQSPAQRALTLLALACAEMPVERMAQLTVGQRDAHLVALRQRTFGSQLHCMTNCPSCNELLELTIDATNIGMKPAAELAEELDVTHAEYTVRFRLPNSLDLANLDPSADSETNRQHLLDVCISTARRNGVEVAAFDLPAEVVKAVAQRMADADPHAEVQLALKCPQCDNAWEAAFDIASYFLSEIHAWASRLLREVHVLATAYGWREGDILGLSPRRRQAYLELIGQ